MSIWHTVKESDDVQLSDDKKTLEVLLNSDHNGNNYIEIPVEFVIDKISANMKHAIRELVWMARRYADGRQTFAATTFNNAYDVLRDIYGDEIEIKDGIVDATLTEKGKFFPYAQDGGDRKMFDAVKGRKYYAV